MSTWYPDFIKEHTRNALYTYSIKDLYDSETWAIDGTDDISHTFNLTMPDFAARVCEVSLDESTIDEVSFSISSSQVATSDMQIIVHCDRFTPEDPFLASAGQQLTISNIKLLLSQDINTLYVVVVNSSQHPPTYTTNGTINLQVNVSMKETPQYNRCMVWFDVLEYYTRIEVSPPDTQSYVRNFWPNWEAVTGSFTNATTWNATWDTVDYWNQPYSGTMQIDFNSDLSTVTGFQVQATRHPDASVVQTISIQGGELPPIVISDPDRARDEVRGPATCTQIITLTDFRDWGYATETLYDIICEESRSVSVYMTVED